METTMPKALMRIPPNTTPAKSKLEELKELLTAQQAAIGAYFDFDADESIEDVGQEKAYEDALERVRAFERGLSRPAKTFDEMQCYALLTYYANADSDELDFYNLPALITPGPGQNINNDQTAMLLVNSVLALLPLQHA
jgi:hypothetical protein